MIVDSRKIFKTPKKVSSAVQPDTVARKLADRWRAAEHTLDREAIRTEIRAIKCRNKALYMALLVVKHLAFKDGNMVNASWFIDFMRDE